MTRLTSDDIIHIPETIDNYSYELQSKIGIDLLGLAKFAVKYSKPDEEIYHATIGIVPCTAGLGQIEGFSDAVEAILACLGFKTLITSRTDVSGFVEAINNNADILFSADDKTFAAIIPVARKTVDNSEATGLGYAAALELAAKKLNGKSVGVIGVGAVGRSAINYLIRKAAKVYAHDSDEAKIKQLTELHNTNLINCSSLEEVLAYAKLIVLAAPGRGIITQDKVSQDMIISAPGMPLGVDEKALDKLDERNLIHDTLEIGVATMAIQALNYFIKYKPIRE